MNQKPKSVTFAPLITVLALAWASPAWALQPLEDFVRGARGHNPGNHEAQANRAAADAQSGVALGQALPRLSAVASYTRNQREVAFGGAIVVPQNQRDATITVTVPLLDLASFQRVRAANRFGEAAAQQQKAAALAIEGRVVQGYFQLAANLALSETARRALGAVQLNARLTEEALAAGTATALDAQRASAEVERQRQQLTGAELEVKLAARALESQTGVTPDTTAVPALGDDLGPAPPLAEFSRTRESTPAVRAAAALRTAADQNATAQRLTLLPVLSGSVSERFTNASAFLGGHDNVFIAQLTLGWEFDFGTASGIRASSAEAAAAHAREDAAKLAAGDAIFGAWNAIDASIARSRSARAQAALSTRAADIARTRYKAGVATQLELIQADRDAFSAEAGRIQSDAELRNARLQLGIAAGIDALAR